MIKLITIGGIILAVYLVVTGKININWEALGYAIGDGIAYVVGGVVSLAKGIINGAVS